MDFKILCIDDEPTWVDSITGEITELLTGLGYVPEIIIRENGNDIDDFLGRPDINLIMVDFNLPDQKGDALIRYILSKGTFVELVFYSQDIAEIHAALGGHAGLVHIKGREDVRQLVIDLCEFIDHRYKNVDIMRGLIVAESIVLEELIEAIMVKSFHVEGEHFQYSVLNQGAYDFFKKLKFVQQFLKEKAAEVQAAYDASLPKDESLKAKKLRIDGCLSKLKPFFEEVIQPRNVVAHGKKLVKADGSVELLALEKKKDNISFNKDWIVACRKKFSDYRLVLKEVLSLDVY